MTHHQQIHYPLSLYYRISPTNYRHCTRFGNCFSHRKCPIRCLFYFKHSHWTILKYGFCLRYLFTTQLNCFWPYIDNTSPSGISKSAVLTLQTTIFSLSKFEVTTCSTGMINFTPSSFAFFIASVRLKIYLLPLG